MRQRDHEVVVLEAADVGHALTRWGSTRFFSPLGMNVPREFRQVLGSRMPSDDALLTGPEMVERVLAPVAASPPLAGCVRTHHRVFAVGRAGMLRGDHAGHPLRGERPFRLVTDTPEGERCFEADVVLDASGASGLSTFLGPGGLPAQGERALADRLVRDLGAFAERLPSFPGRRVLLVGHGHSAATAALALAGLAASAPSTRVIWAVRSANRRPVLEICPDPLPERRR